MQIKRCYKCGETKSTSDFYRNKTRPDGRASACKVCSNAEALARTRANPEPNRRRANKWYHANLARAKKQRREFHEANPELNAERCKQWKTKNKEKYTAAIEAWRARNPEKFGEISRVHNARRRQKTRKSAGPSHTRQDIDEIFRLQRGKCGACRSKLGKGYHVDHIVAIARGGHNGRSNIQILCKGCNHRKSAKPAEVFMREMGRLL